MRLIVMFVCVAGPIRCTRYIISDIMDDAGNWIDLPACIYVEDALMLALDIDHMKIVLAAMIKAIFVVMGKLDIAVR
jgi:hypothetical protein